MTAPSDCKRVAEEYTSHLKDVLKDRETDRHLCVTAQITCGTVPGVAPLGARLSPQYPETAEGAAARVVAAGGPALSAVSRDCRRGCGARGRRWGVRGIFAAIHQH